MIPAGWYRDPNNTPGILRWWDGTQWTQATQPEGEMPGGAQPGDTQAWGVPPGGAQQPSWNWDSVPQPWAQPTAEPAARRSRVLLIGGGAALAIAVIVVLAVLIATGVFGGGGKSGRSPVAGTITDAGAGLSYPRLGGAWRADTVSPTGSLGRLGFDQGESAVVMENFENGDPYVASVYSGVVAGAAPGSLEATAKGIISTLEPVAYPAHTREDLASAAHAVSGHGGWLVQQKFAFPQAKANGWNFRTEMVAVVVVDRGSGLPPAEFYVSIPDSHKKQGDLDLLLSSLKVS